MFAAVKNGRAHVYSDSGVAKNSVGQSGAVSAALCESGEYVLVVYSSGKAALYKSSGVSVRVVVNKDAVGGSISNTQMAIQMSDGKTQIRRVPTGILLRTV